MGQSGFRPFQTNSATLASTSSTEPSSRATKTRVAITAWPPGTSRCAHTRPLPSPSGTGRVRVRRSIHRREPTLRAGGRSPSGRGNAPVHRTQRAHHLTAANRPAGAAPGARGDGDVPHDSVPAYTRKLGRTSLPAGELDLRLRQPDAPLRRWPCRLIPSCLPPTLTSGST